MQFKWLTVPWSNKTKKVQTACMWEVRWDAVKITYRNGLFTYIPQIEVFTEKSAADDFAESLRKAFKLVRFNGSDFDKVDVKKSQYN